jgi:predicted nucleic acid-binding Zn ribbon protein
MPVYEYYCDNCRREVAVTLSISQHDKVVPAGPEWSGKDLNPLVSTFFSQTSRKS